MASSNGRKGVRAQREGQTGGKVSTGKGLAGRERFVIASDFAAGREVQKRILDAVCRCGYLADSTFAIKLALEEALINAIKHGNKFDPEKKVVVEARVTPDETEIVIEDQGPGFKRNCVPDPTREENLEKCSGRGILLMEAYMDSVQYSCGGRRVRLIKRNGPQACCREGKVETNP